MSGALLVLLGIWGALIPFVGPYFDYAYTPDTAWSYTTGRLLFEILPGIGAVLGGLLVLASANRVAAAFGGWLAAVSGAWFVLGPPLATTWDGPTAGEPVGGTSQQVLTYVGFFGGLGVAMVFLSAFALGRFAVVGVREAERAAQSDKALDEPETTGKEPVTTPAPAPAPAAATRAPATTPAPVATPAPASTEQREPADDTRRFPWRRSKHAGTR
jgi:hypothetical protein